MKSMLIFVALAAAGFGGWRWIGPGAHAGAAVAFASEAVATAGMRPIEIKISEDGYLKAKNSIEVRPQFEGQGKLTWLMEEGKAVAKGDKLAEFDKTDVQQRLDDLINDLTVLETQAETARAELEIEKRDGAAQVEAGEFALMIAKMKLEKHIQGEAPNEERKCELEAEKALSKFTRATDRYRQVPELEREGYLTKTQAEEEKINLREAEINKENAAKELELYLQYTKPMAVQELENATKDAERVLTNAREKALISLKEHETKVTNADRQVRAAKQQVEKLQDQISKMTVFAPIAGILLYGDPRERYWNDPIKVGNDIYSGTTLFTLPDLHEMQAVVHVHEADYSSVKLEMPVNVTLESLKGRCLKGKVTEIASVANSDWGDSKTFEVVITLESSEDSLRSGVTAKAEILVETVPDCLAIPIHAAFAEGGKHFAFVLNPTGYDKREVELGKSNLYLVNVIKGLADGERVLLFDPRVSGGGGESTKDEVPAATGDKPSAATALLSASGVGS